ncbi:MAG TPA: glycosyltransferase family A protein [Ferruginibacter sp.]|nr:glycosyltransferase family A protein [Ferruginibacter sp.]
MTQSNLLVSIIMPTWNRAAYIRESVDSVLSQTWQNWELIIVDDGSEDNTEEVISLITDPRIKFYKAGKVGIGIRLKNIGIERSGGELIAFIDSDDLWAPSKLEKQVAVFHDYPHADFSLTGGYNFLKKDAPLEYFYKEREGSKYGDIFISFFTSQASLLPQTLMFRRQCLPVIQHFAKNTPSSDVEFLLGLALQFKAVILYEPLLYRRLHDTGFSIMNWERGYEEGIHVINKYKTHLPAKVAADSLFRLYLNRGEKYLGHKRRGRALGSFLKAWMKKPSSFIPLKKSAKAFLSFLKTK